MNPSAVAVIRLAALTHNLRRVRDAAPLARVMAVIKAQAYGHGAVAAAGALANADAFAVARLDEALELREAGISKPIVLLGGVFSASELHLAGTHDLHLEVHTAEQIDLLEAAPEDSRFCVWLKVNSGMGRLGFQPEAFAASLARLRACSAVHRRIGIMTHLASADQPDNPQNAAQIETMRALIVHWEGDISVANSAALLAGIDCTGCDYSGERWVRPGIMLYGASPLVGESAQQLGLEPVMSFETQLIAVQSLSAGSQVGYGGDWHASRDSRIGVAAVGYADGYPRHLQSGTPVLVNGRTARLAGRVSMDMITVDVTDIPDACIGSRVILWGDSPTVDDIAGRAGTIAYDLLAGVGSRVPRETMQRNSAG